MTETGFTPGSSIQAASDRALAVTVPEVFLEEAGAILMEAFGPFEEVHETRAMDGADEVRLVFYPDAASDQVAPTVSPSLDEILALLPPVLRAPSAVRIEWHEVSREWVDGWKNHFRPIVIGRVRIRPPWEPALDDPPQGLVEVVINPGLGFGTGLHPTTRGTLRLLHTECGDHPVPESSGSVACTTPDAAGDAPKGARDSGRGALLDAGTGSGVLAVAAAKLGWDPVIAFDNDPVALVSARENVDSNGVAGQVTLVEAGVGEVSSGWTGGVTILANMTLEPVLGLLDRLAAMGVEGRPVRLAVSGILAGAQEGQLLEVACRLGLVPGRRVYEGEWVSLELLPIVASQDSATRD